MAAIKDLFAATNQTTNYQCTLCGGTHTPAASAAQLKDTNDGTFSKADWYGDSLDVDVGFLQENWNIDVAAGAWVITFVRVRIRAKRTIFSGTFVGKVSPIINNVGRGTPLNVTNTNAWYEFDFATDPADGLAWTVAKLNAQKWGFEANCEDITDPDASGELYVTEFAVQPHGHIQTDGGLSEMKGEAIAGVAGLITLGALSSCIGESLVGHSAHGITQGVVAEVVGEALPHEDNIPSGPAPIIRPLLSQTLRPTSPADLGDEDLGTLLQHLVTIPPDPASGTLQILATDISDVVGDPGTINAVIFTVRAGLVYTGEPDFTGAQRLKWTVGGVEQTYVLTDAEKISREPPGFSVFHESTVGKVVLGPFFLQPNGSPWSIEALNAIEDVKVEVDYGVGATIEGIRCYEISIEVDGSPAASITERQFYVDPSRVTSVPINVGQFPVERQVVKQIGGTKTRKVVIDL